MVKVITRITGEAVLLPHFARYYQSLGVGSFVIAIEEGMAGAWQTAQEIAATLDAQIVPVPAARPLAGIEAASEEEIWRALVAPDDWIIPAGIDEFIEFPAPIPALIEEMNAADATFLAGKICDRIAAGGVLACAIEDGSIWAQYPLACRFSEMLNPGRNHKVTLCRGDCELTPGRHHVIRPARPLVTRGCVVHHFKWRQGILETLEQQVERRMRVGFEADPESARAIAYLKANGRIIPGDFGAVQGWRPDPPKLAAKTIVYTAISKGYDLLREPKVEAGPETALVAFTDDPEGSRGWQLRSLHAGFEDPCRNAKIHKILPHLYFPDAAYSLWVDGSLGFRIRIPIEEWIATYLANHDLAVFKHPVRNCIYAEADECIQIGADDPETIAQQMRKYRYEGYPRLAGLTESSVLLRRHTPRMKLLNEVWWDEISRHSRRDQLSFNYVAWKLSFTYATLPGAVDQNAFFERKAHLTPETADSRGTADGSGPMTPISARAVCSPREQAKLLRTKLSAAKLENKRLRQTLQAAKKLNRDKIKARLALMPLRLLERAIRTRRKELLKAFSKGS
jgi:hypothetical protein